MSGQYIPGTCNIGKSEIRRRQNVALIGALATLLGAISMINKYHSHLPRLWLFIPAMVFAVGWIQSRKKFCLAYGFMGVFNFSDKSEISKVASKEDLAADRAMALSILFQSAILAAAVTGLIYFIPS